MPERLPPRTELQRRMSATARMLYRVLDPHVATSARALLRLARHRLPAKERTRARRRRRHAFYRELLREHHDACGLYCAVMSGQLRNTGKSRRSTR